MPPDDDPFCLCGYRRSVHRTQRNFCPLGMECAIGDGAFTYSEGLNRPIKKGWERPQMFGEAA